MHSPYKCCSQNLTEISNIWKACGAGFLEILGESAFSLLNSLRLQKKSGTYHSVKHPALVHFGGAGAAVWMWTCWAGMDDTGRAHRTGQVLRPAHPPHGPGLALYPGTPTAHVTVQKYMYLFPETPRYFFSSFNQGCGAVPFCRGSGSSSGSGAVYFFHGSGAGSGSFLSLYIP